MWPFNKKGGGKTGEPAPRDVYKEHADFLNRVAPIGSQFIYLGIPMRVAKYESQHFLGFCDVVAEYVDRTGVIREKVFDSDRIQDLNPRKPDDQPAQPR